MTRSWPTNIHASEGGRNYSVRIPKELIKDTQFPFPTRRSKTPTGRETVEIAKLDGYEITIGPGVLTIGPRPEEEVKPQIEHLNLFDDHVTLKDNEANRIFNVYIRDRKLWCELCGSHSCIHVGYSLSIPKFNQTLSEKGVRFTSR